MEWLRIRVEQIKGKIKVMPETKAFIIGMTLLILAPICLLLIGYFTPISYWLIGIIEGWIMGVAIFFLASSTVKRRSRLNEERGKVRK